MIKFIITYFIILLQLQALDISKQKNFTVTLKPTTQVATFSLSHIAKTSNEIENLFQKALITANKSGICRGGQYRIYPDYKYVENRKIEIGYNSNINFHCEFNDIKKYENLLVKIKKLNIKLTQNAISYKISTTKQEEEKSQLEFLAYEYAKQYTKKLNNIFHNCNIKTINFNNSHTPILYKTLARQEAATTVTSPIEEDITLSLSVDYIFNCEN